MHRRRRLLLVVFVALVCTAAAGVLPSVARAEPCWHKVISDWTGDGRIDGHYSTHCLRQAYKNAPEDLRDYSSILDDINAAIIAATTTTHSKGGGPNGGGSSGSGSGQSGGTGPSYGKNQQQQTARANHAVPGAGSSASDPGRDRSVPLPLIILGAVLAGGALLGAAPHLIGRFRGRFPRLRPTPGSVRPPA